MFMHAPRVVLAGLLLVPLAAAQLPDYQPGRNFPTASNAFGTGHTENIDVGDIDRDGDYDVLVANGGDSGNQPNRIYVNNGGLQGGTEGTYTEDSAARLAGAPQDTSRDCEFVDVDDDGDLDIYISNRGGSGGQVSRAYTNLGGLQGGTIGFFTESTSTFWGDLATVALSREQGVQDGQGPWNDWSCDCDFADVDDDGDLDLFHSSYGFNISGEERSRIFLNDAEGRFDELGPWCDPPFDLTLHTMDIDLADFDDDFDLDIYASSRDSQSRVYRNNTYGGTGDGRMFSDVTETSLLDNFSEQGGESGYEAEYADLDGDGDFDVWAINYKNFTDKILRNQGNLDLIRQPFWIRGDPSVDDNEIDFLDYDNDGDLDALACNFSGVSYLYQSSVAEGLPFMDGVFHRTGQPGESPNPEIPTNANGTSALDADCADMDGDGDTDIVFAKDGGFVNRLWTNALGVPDTHAPWFWQVTDQADKADGSDTVIHAQVRDNAAYYIINYYRVNLFYSVDGGDEVCMPMFNQAGQQWRGVIPGGLDGTITYRCEVTDDNGNHGVSDEYTYEQTSTGDVAFELLGCGTEGTYGVPFFRAYGDQTVGSNTVFMLQDANPNSIAALYISAASTPAPFKGGVLYTVPVLITIGLPTSSGGQIVFQFPWPAGLPGDTTLWWQYAISDPAGEGGLTLSNAVAITTP